MDNGFGEGGDYCCKGICEMERFFLLWKAVHAEKMYWWSDVLFVLENGGWYGKDSSGEVDFFCLIVLWILKRGKRIF